jgi:hypothetical protein
MGKDDLDGNDFGDIAVAERSPETVSRCGAPAAFPGMRSLLPR